MVDGILVSWKRFERVCLLHTSVDCLGLLFSRVTVESSLLLSFLCPEVVMSLLFLLMWLISVVVGQNLSVVLVIGHV